MNKWGGEEDKKRWRGGEVERNKCYEETESGGWSKGEREIERD